MLYHKNVFILGAGFSADAGAPVMKDFLQKAKHLLDDPGSGLTTEDRETFKRIFEFLRGLRAAQAKTTLDLENIEHLFGVAEMDLEFGASNRGTFRRDLIFVILRTLERSIRADLSKGAWPIVVREENQRWSRGVAANYGELFAALVSRRWLGGTYAIPQDGACQDTIITMNYDCFLDHSLIALQVNPDYALTKVSYQDDYTKFPYRIALLKLHGSANWIRCASESCRGRIWIWKKGPSPLEYFYGLACQACGRQALEPVVVPPTWAKGTHAELFAPIWSRALRALQEAGRIFIIGYSMPDADAFFQYMLGLALATNEKIDQVVVVGRNSEIGKKFAALFQQHFRERRFVFESDTTHSFVTGQKLGGIYLGQYEEGLDRSRIEASGFRLS